MCAGFTCTQHTAFGGLGSNAISISASASFLARCLPGPGLSWTEPFFLIFFKIQLLIKFLSTAFLLMGSYCSSYYYCGFQLVKYVAEFYFHVCQLQAEGLKPRKCRKKVLPSLNRNRSDWSIITH